VGWSSSREHQGTVPVNRPVIQYNHKSESLVLSAGWPVRGILKLYFNNKIFISWVVIKQGAPRDGAS